jgi:hypothetical protein
MALCRPQLVYLTFCDYPADIEGITKDIAFVGQGLLKPRKSCINMGQLPTTLGTHQYDKRS